MALSKLVGLLFEAWKDTDRALAGLDPAEAMLSRDGGSSYAWTAAHVANQIDAWINVRFQRLDPHEPVSQHRFRVGGSGAADDWQAIQAGIRQVREAARAYLRGLGEDDLDLVIPYAAPSRTFARAASPCGTLSCASAPTTTSTSARSPPSAPPWGSESATTLVCWTSASSRRGSGSLSRVPSSCTLIPPCSRASSKR